MGKEVFGPKKNKERNSKNGKGYGKFQVFFTPGTRHEGVLPILATLTRLRIVQSVAPKIKRGILKIEMLTKAGAARRNSGRGVGYPLQKAQGQK